ncbi:UNVERIFIED_CONTAM: hypothetical protein PYX00_007209 [Menopon gallinae]|uniref:TAPT1-like protein n=2 Tax=Menopon gallinae TaxID=328185 RepID=A0AAW2HIU1_9NEOP
MPITKDHYLSGRRIRFRTNSSNYDRFEELCNSDRCYEGNEHSKPSLLQFLKVELTRGYLLEHDEERYSARREKVYSFMKIPREVEKFTFYGFLQCADSFLFVYTFLPLRIILALWAVISRPIMDCFGWNRPKRNCVLKPAEICDLLKACILVTCSIMMLYIDTSMMYHLIRSQSVIKLYIFFNMLEVSDRLFSAFGQDTIDALFWTAIEPRDRGREHLGVIPHLLLSIIYVFLHGLLVLFQATTLNVAINSNNKALLTIMMSNQFVELKGSVFKKFDKNNLFQVSCSDVRERFHLFVLLFIVVLQTMKEYSWKGEQLWILLPDCVIVLVSEVFVDWIKHAFISRFNELPADVYKDYTISLAYDVAQTRQKNAFADHSDWVARRMGFIPLPLGVVMYRVLVQTVSLDGGGAIILLILAFLALASFRILNSLVILGKACDLISQHKQDKATGSQNWSRANSPTQPNPFGKVSRELFPHRDVATSPGFAEAPPGDITKLTPQGKEDGDIKTSSAKKKKNSKEMDANLGPAALFSNSTVDINSVCLNEELLKEGNENSLKSELEAKSRSTPDIQKDFCDEKEVSPSGKDCLGKRAESEPSIPLLVDNEGDSDSET